MSFHKYGQTVKFPRDEHVEIHVRTVMLNADAPPEAQVPHVEIREYLKAGEVYGYGIVLPLHVVKDLRVALDRIVPVEAGVGSHP